jgi:adiponectin receptor
VGFDDAPAYQQDNPFIRTGYRANFAVSTCLVSLFRLHNQTCNVWSHLLGVPVFLALALYTYLFIAPEDVRFIHSFLFIHQTAHAQPPTAHTRSHARGHSLDFFVVGRVVG